MSIDRDQLKRDIRDALDERDREKEREARDKARDDRLAELEAALKAKPKKEEGDPNAHDFEPA